MWTKDTTSQNRRTTWGPPKRSLYKKLPIAHQNNNITILILGCQAQSWCSVSHLILPTTQSMPNLQANVLDDYQNFQHDQRHIT